MDNFNFFNHLFETSFQNIENRISDYDSAPIVQTTNPPLEEEKNKIEIPLMEEEDKQKKDIPLIEANSSEPNEKMTKKTNITQKNARRKNGNVTRKSFAHFILAIFMISIFIIFNLISIIDVVIQFINPNGLNNLIVDDILLILVTIFMIVKLENCLGLIGCFMSIGFIVSPIIFFIYFFNKNKRPKYILYFYISYFSIKYISLIIFILFSCYIEKKKENSKK